MAFAASLIFDRERGRTNARTRSYFNLDWIGFVAQCTVQIFQYTKSTSLYFASSKSMEEDGKKINKSVTGKSV